MRIQRHIGQLPYSLEQLFDTAADIERYPAFMRGWREVRLVSRTDTGAIVDQVVGLGPLTLSFRTTARFQRPSRIDIGSSDPAFRTFGLQWVFAREDAHTCAASVSAEIALRARWLDVAAQPLLPGLITDVADAFAERVRHLYPLQPITATPARPD